MGSYIVDCEEIQRQRPDDSGDMVLDIRASGEPEVFLASFAFGVVEGVMILSNQKSAIANYRSKIDEESDAGENDTSESDDSGSHNDSDEDSSAHWDQSRSAKRKAKGQPNTQAKKAKTARGKPRVLYFEWRGRETGEGEIMPDSNQGVVTFDSPQCASLTGKIDVPFISRGVHFTARKVSEIPRKFHTSWNSFSEYSYERARVGRWR